MLSGHFGYFLIGSSALGVVVSPQSLNYHTKTLTLFVMAPLWLPSLTKAQPQDSVPLSAKVVRIAGSVRSIDKNNRQWKAVHIGDEFTGDFVLQTDSTGSTAADIDVVGSDAGRTTVRMFSNCVLKVPRLNSKMSGSAQARDISFNVPTGKIRVSLDGISDYVFLLEANSFSMRLTVDRNPKNPDETTFTFAGTGDLTVLKGSVKASVGSGPEIVICAGEQLLRGDDKVTKAPPDAPELKAPQ
jgi:hypothetical protein